MSVFVVDTVHVDAMISAGLALRHVPPLAWWDVPPRLDWSGAEAEPHRRTLTRTSADQVGAMLLAANIASVNYRYDEHDLVPPYRYRPLPGRPDPVIVLAAVDCYEYQSCEAPGWRDSQARLFCDALRSACWHALPGYDAAPWKITDRRVFLSVRQCLGRPPRADG